MVGARLEVIAEIRLSVTVPRVETTDLIRLCAAGVIFIACAAILWKLWRPARRSKRAPLSTSREEPVVNRNSSLPHQSEQPAVDPNRTADGLFVVDPVLLASETQAWLDQDWFGIKETSEGVSSSDAHGASEHPTPFSTFASTHSPQHTTQDRLAESDLDKDTASELEDPQLSDDVEDAEIVEPWQDAAIASIPSKKEAKKAARLADAETAREASRVKKQLKRDAKISRKKQPSLPVLENDEAFSLAPFTALPVKPPTKREVRKSVRAAAKEVKALRRQERETEKAAQLAQRKLRETEKAAAEEAVRKRLAAVAAVAAEQAAAEQASKMSAWEVAAVEMEAATPAPLPNPWGEAVSMAPPASLATQQVVVPSAWESAATSMRPSPVSAVAPEPVVALGEFFAPAPVATPSSSTSAGSDAWQSSAMAGFWETTPVALVPPASKPSRVTESPVDINKFGLPEPLPVRKADQPDGPQLQS